jgi:uncharacterized membrane protein HdeD (DUF308 family)
MATFFKSIRNTVKYWYVPAIVGLLLVVLGGYLFTVPLGAYLMLTMLFSISFLVSGILETYFFHSKQERARGLGMVSGKWTI